MGALAPALLTTGLTAATSMAQNSQALRQMEAQDALEEQQRAESNALQKAQIDADARTAEADRRRALRSAVARQNARTGASGIVSGDGSSEAVILGLFNESEEEAKQREESDALRKAALDQDLEQRQSLNLLQREQFAEQQNTKNALGAFGKLF